LKVYWDLDRKSNKKMSKIERTSGKHSGKDREVKKLREEVDLLKREVSKLRMYCLMTELFKTELANTSNDSNQPEGTK